MNDPTPLSNEELSSAVIVGIEVATHCGGIALASGDGRLLAHAWQENSQPVSRRILSQFDRLLKELQIDPSRIRAVGATHGPGAFTGLRVGLTVAKTLAHGLGRSFYGISTLEAMARRWPLGGSIVCPLLDARRGELYSGLYRVSEGGRPQVLREDRVGSLSELLSELEETSWPAIFFSGNGATLHQGSITQRLGGRPQWITPPWNAPGADSVALGAADDWRSGRPGSDPLSAQPIYLRSCDAERKRLAEATPIEEPTQP